MLFTILFSAGNSELFCTNYREYKFTFKNIGLAK